MKDSALMQQLLATVSAIYLESGITCEVRQVEDYHGHDAFLQIDSPQKMMLATSNNQISVYRHCNGKFVGEIRVVDMPDGLLTLGISIWLRWHFTRQGLCQVRGQIGSL